MPMWHIPAETANLLGASSLHANLEVNGLSHAHLLIKQLS